MKDIHIGSHINTCSLVFTNPIAKYITECIRDPCPVRTVSTYIVLMVWLKSAQSQHSKTYCRLNALEILIPYVDSVNIYSI